MLQRGAGLYMRDRLKRSGVDLGNQGLNQQLARAAQRFNLATLDLSNASDTLSIETVFAFLPIDWAMFLDDLRSKETRIAGNWRKLEKFSSMGNGFTFELETLIFYCLAYASAKVDDLNPFWVTAYGDDIIVPREAYDTVVDALSFFGFSVNSEKSYKEGPFFESCGKHYFNGHDVTPVYQKAEVDDGLHERIRFFNRLTRLSLLFCESTVYGPLANVLKQLRPSAKKVKHGAVPAIPMGCEGDDGYLVDRRLLRWDVNHGYHCRVYRFQAREKPARGDHPYLAYRLRKGKAPVDRFGRPADAHPSEGRWRLTWGDFHVGLQDSKLSFVSEETPTSHRVLQLYESFDRKIGQRNASERWRLIQSTAALAESPA
jgi:hypothetical protein